MKRIYLILLIIPLFWQSCKIHEPDLFDQNPSERLIQTLNNVNTILKAAPNGWIMDYYPGVGDFSRAGARNPNPRQWGGYTLLFEFKDNDLVTIRTFFGRPPRDGRDSSATSMYQLIPETGPVLSFTTFNPILHYFTNPRNPDGINRPQGNQGMNGDSEFIIMSASAEKIVLRGKTENNQIILRPFNESISQGKSKAEYLATINFQEQNLIFAYSSYLYIDGTDTATVVRGSTAVLDPDGTIPIRLLTFTYPDPTGGDFDIVISRAFVSDLDGIVFYEPLELFGKTITRMNHDLTPVNEHFSVPGQSGTMTPIIAARYVELLGTYIMHFGTTTTVFANANRNRRLEVTVTENVPGVSFKLEGVFSAEQEARGPIIMGYDPAYGFTINGQILHVRANGVDDLWLRAISEGSTIGTTPTAARSHGMRGDVSVNAEGRKVITMVCNGVWTSVTATFILRSSPIGANPFVTVENVPTRPTLGGEAGQNNIAFPQFVKQP